MGFQVITTALAERDLLDATYFLGRKSPPAALNLGLKLIADAESLHSLPNRGSPSATRKGYRRLVRRPSHLIFYRVDEAHHIVEIMRIWDARRDPSFFRISENDDFGS